MIWLWLGVGLWSGLHLFRALASRRRARLIERFGEVPYKIGFAVGIGVSIVLMVVGWRAASPPGAH
jgi:hypothetical protein